ncbi:Partner of xrn-2 protein 1 [Taenia solium]|eukprot:TsM_000537200 transcript=TsM_000537200 gene=TsM_000537200
MTDQPAAIDGMRRPHENPTEWRLRKAFLVKNFDALGPERLECLSNCFVNHELYGAGYPGKVMSEIQKYGEGIIDSIYNSKSSFTPIHIK